MRDRVEASCGNHQSLIQFRVAVGRSLNSQATASGVERSHREITVEELDHASVRVDLARHRVYEHDRRAEESQFSRLGEVRSGIAASKAHVVDQTKSLNTCSEDLGIHEPSSVRTCIERKPPSRRDQVIDIKSQCRSVASSGSHDTGSVSAVVDLRDSTDDSAVIPRACPDEANRVDEFRDAAAHFAHDVICKIQHTCRVFQDFARHPVRNCDLLRDKLHAVPTGVTFRRARIFSNEVRLQTADPARHDEGIRRHLHVASVGRERSELFDKNNDLIEHLIIYEYSALRVHSLTESTAVDHAVIRAPASSVAVLEERGLEELTGTIRTLFSVLSLEVLETTGAGEVVVD